MFITRATRHDRGDLEELLRSHGREPDLGEGTTFISRDGGVVGCVRLVELAPQTVVVDDVLVRDGRRGSGIAGGLMQAAMNSRGGTLYLCCHEGHLGFYGRFGFEPVDVVQCPEPVVDYWRKFGDYPAEPGHTHFYLKAR